MFFFHMLVYNKKFDIFLHFQSKKLVNWVKEENTQKCQMFMIFLNSEINEIDMGSLILQNFQNPNGKNLDLQVKMCFAK